MGCLVAFFALFLLVGFALTPFLAWPIARTIGARSWRAVPCTILASGVKEHSGSDGSTYSVEVRYEYEVDGRLYRGDRYRFLGGSSSGYDGKAGIVAGLPVGSRQVCYVDPKDPSRSVFNRSFGAWVLLGLIPVGLIGLGLWGIVANVRRPKPWKGVTTPYQPGGGGVVPSGPVECAWLPEPRGEVILPPGGVGEGALVLKADAGPVGKFVGLTFIALFWNGIVSLFLKDVVAGWQAGHGDGCQSLFLVPFVLIGIALLLSIPYQFLALFNPRPRLVLDRCRLRPGEPARLSWSFSGASGRIRKLKIAIEGREEASYRRGTNTHTDRATFATFVLFDGDPALGTGEVEVKIPSGSMHSFSASHNKIVWKLAVAGEIARWPDVAEDFELVVVPEEPRRSA